MMVTSERNFILDLEWATRSAMALKQFCVKSVVTLLTAMRNRRDINRLNDLDDWQLHDIGLTRQDVWQGNKGSFFDDPSAHLTKVALRRSRNMGMDD